MKSSTRHTVEACTKDTMNSVSNGMYGAGNSPVISDGVLAKTKCLTPLTGRVVVLAGVFSGIALAITGSEAQALDVVSSSVVQKTEIRTPGKVAAALFVDDCTVDGVCKPYLTQLGNQLAAALNKDGFGIVRPEDTLGMAERVDGAQNRTMINQQVAKGEHQDLDNASIIQLARDLGVECYFKASITGAEVQNVDIAGKFIDFRLDLTLNGYGTQIGDGMYGETVSTTYRDTRARFTANKQFIITEALKSAANKVATSFAEGYPKLAPREAKKAYVTFNAALNANSALLGFVKDKGETDNDIPLYARVDVDGFAMGTTKGVIVMTEGLHVVTVSYPYCETQTFRARFADGQVYNVDMKFTEAGIQRYKDTKVWDLEYNDYKRKLDTAYKHAQYCVENFNREWNSQIDIGETNAFTAARIAETTCNRAFDNWLKEIEADVTKTVDKHAAAVKISKNESDAAVLSAEKQGELAKMWAQTLSYVLCKDADGRYQVADGEGKFRSESYWRKELQERNSKTEISDGIKNVTHDTKSTEINPKPSDDK